MKFIVLTAILLFSAQSFACKNIIGKWSCEEGSSRAKYTLEVKKMAQGLTLISTSKSGVITTVAGTKIETVNKRVEKTTTEITCTKSGAELVQYESGVVLDEKDRTVRVGNKTIKNHDYTSVLEAVFTVDKSDSSYMSISTENNSVTVINGTNHQSSISDTSYCRRI